MVTGFRRMLTAKRGNPRRWARPLVAGLVLLLAGLLGLPKMWLGIGFGAVFCWGTVELLQSLRVEWITVALVVAGEWLDFLYLSYTRFNVRNFDTPEQAKYLLHLARHWELPSPNQCLVCHHPPLYYAIAAAAHNFFEQTGLVQPIFGLQLLSLPFALAFVVFTILTVSRYTSRIGILRVVAALVVFWPYLIVHSVTLHNDMLVTALSAGALFFIVKWEQERRGWDLIGACLAAFLAAATKSTGYVAMATVTLVALSRIRWNRATLFLDPRRTAAGVLAAVLVVLGLTWRLGLFGPQRYSSPTVCQRLLGSACSMGRDRYVGNGLYNYAYFDFAEYLRRPYFVEWPRGGETELFWNNLIKSSLFGTHSGGDPQLHYGLNDFLASGMNLLLLALVALVVLRLLAAPFTEWCRLSPVLIHGGLSLLSLVLFRAWVPVPHHNDFRHVFPMLVGFAVLLAWALQWAGQAKLAVFQLARAGALLFVVASILYFLPKREWLERYAPPAWSAGGD